MKKTYTIQVEIDTEAESKLGSRAEITNVNYSRVVITGKEQKDFNYSLPNILAHELGHVIGRIFKTPAHMADPRMPQNYMNKENYGMNIVQSEKEAWAFGEEMIMSAMKNFHHNKSHALSTYEPYLDMKFNVEEKKDWFGRILPKQIEKKSQIEHFLFPDEKGFYDKT